MPQKKKESIPEGEALLCPLRHAIGVVGGKWKLPIICMLESGEPTRYSVIKKKLSGITNMMLAQSLKELEAEEMLIRKQYNEVPPRVEYTISAKGKSLVPILIELAHWATKNGMDEKRATEYCQNCQKSK